MKLKQIVKAWDQFFFSERPVEGMALFRIVWMGTILIYFLLDLPNLADFYGPGALVPLEVAREQFPYLHANVFHLFKPSLEVTYALAAILGLSLVFSVIGLFTRPAMIVAFICMVSFHQRSIWMLSSSELLMRLITLFLIFAPCGNRLSLDALLAKHDLAEPKSARAPIWTLRLIQIQISVLYLWTFWHKLKGDTWIDGTAVYYATRIESMTNFSVPFLMNSLPFLKLMTWGTLLLEFSLGILIWIKEFRKPLIYLGVLFHLGIEFFMSIPFFEIFMVALLMNFFTPEEQRSFVLSLRVRARAWLKRVRSEEPNLALGQNS
jgi:hypothetical protein